MFLDGWRPLEFLCGTVVLRVLAVLLGTLPVSAGEPASTLRPFEGSLVVSQLPLTVAGAVSGPEAHLFTSWYPDGSRIVRVDVTASASSSPKVTLLTDAFTAARDPDVGYGGTEVLFSARKDSGARWQIWRLTLEDRFVEAVTRLKVDCFSPRHLPNGWIAFFAPTGHCGEDGPVPATALYVGDPDDASFTRVTFNVSSDFRPLVLPDGRLLFSSWRRHGTYHGARGAFSLSTVQWDGCGVWTFDDVHRPRGVRVPMAVTPDGAVLCVRYPTLSALDGEEVLAFDAGDSFAGERVVAGSDYGSYRSIQPVDDQLLVTSRPRGTRSYGVYQLGREERRSVPIFDDPGYDETDVALLAPHSRPLVRFTGVDDERKTGQLFCQDIYRSSVHTIPRGKVHRVRIIEGIPIPASEAGRRRFLPRGDLLDLRGTTVDSATGFIQKRILGEIAPAEDGSFAAEVPADRPLHIQLVDRRGVALATQATWIWVRPGESRGCIGCHEDRETSVRNQACLAIDRGAVQLPESESLTVDFRRDVKPVLARNCGVESCHSGVEPTAELNLDPLAGLADEVAIYDRVYEGLLHSRKNKPPVIGGALVHPGVARDSPLVWMVFGRKLGNQYKPAPFRRPIGRGHPEKEIPAADLRVIAQWVDLGAQWDNLPGPELFRLSPAGETVLRGDPRDDLQAGDSGGDCP